MERKKKKNGRAAATAVAAVTAAGVLIGGAFSSPDELLDDGPDAIVQTLAMGAPAESDGGPGGDGGEEEDERGRGLSGTVHRLVRAAPLGVRVCVGLPLWALGTLMIALASSLWSAVLSPLAATVLGWLGVALLAALIFALAAKTLFPELPLKKILNRRSLLTILLLSLAFGVLDALLPFFWEDYKALSQVLKLAGSLICTGVPVAFFARRHLRRLAEAAAAAEPEEPDMAEREREARRLVTELADSVCPRLY